MSTSLGQSLAGECCTDAVLLPVVVMSDVTVPAGLVQLFPDGALIDDDVEIFIEDEGEVFFV